MVSKIIQVDYDFNSNKILNFTMNAGAIPNSYLATNPLARANHTGTQLAATISDFDTQVRTSRLDQMANPTAAVSMNSQKITNLANGTANADAANYGQLLALANGTSWLAPVLCKNAAGVNIATLSGEQTLDGQLTSASRVLLSDQTTASQNGLWITSAGSWTRPTDFATASNAASKSVFVEKGSTFGDTQWNCTSDPGADVVGTNNLTFAQFGAAVNYTADGTTLQLTGTQFSIKSTYVGQASITTLGTIGTGAWQGTKVAEVYGGTNQNAYALGDTLYSSATNTLSKLAGNTTTTRKFIRQTGNGTISAAPAWDTVTQTDVGLPLVENTALSTWAGTSNITTVGTVTAGTFRGLNGKYTTLFGNGSASSFVITHGLGTKDIYVAVRNTSTDALEEFSVVATSTTTCTIACNSVPASNAYQAIVVA